MSVLLELPDFLTRLLKDKPAFYLVMGVICVVLLFLLVIIAISFYKGRHFKLWLFEINKPGEKKDPEPLVKAETSGHGQTNMNAGTNYGAIGSNYRNHNVGGNNYGINGDVVSEPHLHDDHKDQILKRLNHIRDSGISTKNIHFRQALDCNVPTMGVEIREFLESQGYTITIDSVSLAMDPKPKGIVIQPTDDRSAIDFILPYIKLS